MTVSEKYRGEYNDFQQLKMLRHRTEVCTNFAGKVLQNLDLVNNFYNDHLPFELTDAQKKVIKEIYHDMCTGEQMNRLLQGDVGSGKTIVAFVCMLVAASTVRKRLLWPQQKF